MAKKYKYLYKITNTLNNKIYVGVHITNTMDDGYMGSGIHILRAIKKYGREYFTKEILQTFNTIKDMYEAESIIVNEDFVKDVNTYNLMVGGVYSGWDKKRHNEESKAKISKANAIHQAGSGNSQYGKIWISNNETQQSKRIPKTSEIPEGWVLGRNNWKTVSREQAEQYRRDAFNAKVISRRAKKQESDRDKAIKLHKLYTEHGFSSIREFARSEFYDKSHVTLSKLFKLL